MTYNISSNTLLKDYLNEKVNIQWDRIVLSVSDQRQAECNEILLKKKYGDHLQLKSGSKIHVIPDPPYLKKGNGGVIVYVINKLVEEFGESTIWKEKILLILSGGFSKRLPTGSVVGKIFTALPSQLSSDLTMWDMKLAHTSLFSERAPAGIFVTCADDIEPFTLESTNVSSVKFGTQFTAIAHPIEDLQLASQHGIYVTNASQETSCIQVLQKPTVQKLQDLQKEEDLCIFIDSAFFFTHEVSRAFLTWSRNTPYWYSIELDAYGDILTSLNTQRQSPSTDHNVPNEKSHLLTSLQRFSLDLVLLSDSYFIHLGTNREYLDNLTRNHRFMREIGCTATSSSTANVICSQLSSDARVSNYSVVEYCNIQSDIEISDDVILSHCFCSAGPKLFIPRGLIMQTIPIFHPLTNRDGFVTILLGVEDDLKQSIRDISLDECFYMNRSLSRYPPMMNSSTKSISSLWFAKLFPVFDSGDLSFRFTATLAQLMLQTGSSDIGNELFQDMDTFISMDDIVRLKNVPKLISMRKILNQ